MAAFPHCQPLPCLVRRINVVPTASLPLSFPGLLVLVLGPHRGHDPGWSVTMSVIDPREYKRKRPMMSLG
jgi:hypothetical protein